MRLLFALLFIWASATYAAEPAAAPSSLQVALTNSKTWLNTSRALDAKDVQGRIVLLDFWTLGCINCMDVIPDLKALEHEFGSSLTVIGVHSAKFTNEKDTDNIRSAILRYGVTHPVVNDADFSVWNAFGVRAWPTLVLMSPEGKITNVYAGEGNKAALEENIRSLIEHYKGTLVTTPLPLAPEAAKQPTTAFRFPGKLITRDAQHLIVADSGHNRIVVTDMTGAVSETIGSGAEGLKDGSFEQAQFFKPQGIAYKDGLLYVADLGNHALRLVDFNTHLVSTLAGNGTEGRFIDHSQEAQAKDVLPSSPWDVTFYPDTDHLAVAMAGAHQIWSYDLKAHTVSMIAGNGQEGIEDGHGPFNSLAQPSGLFAAGDVLYFTDAESSALRKLDKDGTVTTLIGKGLFDFGYEEGGTEKARMQHCSGLTGDGKNIYIADTYNHSIRKYDLVASTLSNYAGHDTRGHADGALAAASFNEPTGITFANNTLYVADTDNHLLRAIDMTTKTVSTLGAALAPVAPAPIASVPAQPVIEAPTAVTQAPAAALVPTSAEPNLAKLSFSVAADTPIDVALDLKPGTHINTAAPSMLSLEMGKNGETPLLGFKRDMLMMGHVMLPKLKAGRPYLLEGTLYYCSDAAASLCMIKSFAVTLMPDGKDTKITLPVY